MCWIFHERMDKKKQWKHMKNRKRYGINREIQFGEKEESYGKIMCKICWMFHEIMGKKTYRKNT